MAGLLPYMGHQNLLDKIKFDQSWRDPGNWMAGSTIVPEFLDPTYPDRSRQVAFGDLPVDFAATHYVGIAGVGLDAASYKRGDPATVHKRGPFSYDESATMAEIGAGRGAANTILMIQVPHDGVTGVSPWIAGGGATLRGVPEKNSIAPFVAANHDKKRGTYAMMADGSVRFIDQNVSDDVFKAMCTIAGPAPPDFDLNKDPNTPLIPAPVDKSVKELDKKTPVKADPPRKAPDKEPAADKKTPATADPPKKEPEKVDVQKKPDKAPPIEEAKKEPSQKEPVKKDADSSASVAGDKAALQGTWRATSALHNGNPTEIRPQNIGKSPAFLDGLYRTFKGNEMEFLYGDHRSGKNPYKVDSTKSPKQIEYTALGDKGPTLGIYELNGADLKLCWADPGRPRPTAFESPPGSQLTLEVFRKVDDKKK